LLDGHLKAFVELDSINSFKDFLEIHIEDHDINLSYRIDARKKRLVEDRSEFIGRRRPIR
jgi:hypothetical protein